MMSIDIASTLANLGLRAREASDGNAAGGLGKYLNSKSNNDTYLLKRKR